MVKNRPRNHAEQQKYNTSIHLQEAAANIKNISQSTTFELRTTVTNQAQPQTYKPHAFTLIKSSRNTL